MTLVLQQQQQQHSLFSQASWGRLEMKPERNTVVSHDLGFILFNLFMFVHHFGCFVLQCMIIFTAELKRSLYALCSQYGRILDVVALKTQKLRGQAWVVFSEITAATNAFRGLQDFDFYGKKMVLRVHLS